MVVACASRARTLVASAVINGDGLGRRWASVIAVCVAAVLAMTTTQLKAANLILDGSFENEANLSLPLSPWTLANSDGSNFIWNGNPQDGGNSFVWQQTGSLAILSQTVAAPAGQYTLSFYLDAWQDGGTHVFTASVGGVQLATLTDSDFQVWPGNPGDFTPYVSYSFPVTVSSANPVVEFQFQDDNGTSYLDNISMVSVPEPATLSLLLVGGLAFLRKRRP
jgi:hypothetical protein